MTFAGSAPTRTFALEPWQFVDVPDGTGYGFTSAIRVQVLQGETVISDHSINRPRMDGTFKGLHISALPTHRVVKITARYHENDTVWKNYSEEGMRFNRHTDPEKGTGYFLELGDFYGGKHWHNMLTYFYIGEVPVPPPNAVRVSAPGSIK